MTGAIVPARRWAATFCLSMHSLRRQIVVGLAAILAAATSCARASREPRYVGPDSLTLVVAGTTDVHGWLRGWDYFTNAPDTTRGLTRVATIVDSLRAANPDRVLLVDAGDLLQGTLMATIALRDSLVTNPIIAAMNAMQYDAAAIGNHEFNYGTRYLGRAINQATFPFLAANALSPSGTRAFVPWTLVTRSGVKVGIVGGTTPGSMIWDRDKLAGRVVIGDIVPAVAASTADARSKGADVVIVVLHAGLADAASYDTTATGLPSENVAARVAREVPGVNLVVFGHSHRELPDTTIGAALVTQPRNWAGSVSVSRLSLARSGGRWRVTGHRGGVIRARGHAEQPALLASTATAHRRAVELATSPIGSTSAAWRADSARVVDTPILDFILEVERRVSGADLASVAAFNLNASFGPGPITVAKMAELYPYENNVLRAVRISGRQLREYLEFSSRYFRERASGDSLIDASVPGFNYDIVAGVDYVIDISKPVGSRVTTLTRNGRPVADNDSFTMALHDYRQQGGGGFAMLRGAPVVYDEQKQIRQLLIDEVQRKGTLNPADYFKQNWRLAPDSLVGAAYRSMRRLPYDRPPAVRPTPPSGTP
jgi:2',3'-cyclic-nucleotide 2'-phosphodiesterase (5'-nucleotidase family)